MTAATLWLGDKKVGDLDLVLVAPPAPLEELDLSILEGESFVGRGQLNGEASSALLDAWLNEAPPYRAHATVPHRLAEMPKEGGRVLLAVGDRGAALAFKAEAVVDRGLYWTAELSEPAWIEPTE